MELESATGKLNAYFDGRQPEIAGMDRAAGKHGFLFPKTGRT